MSYQPATRLPMGPEQFYKLYDGGFIEKDLGNYLWSDLRESPDNYNKRAVWTVYKNWIKKAVNIYVAYCMDNAKAEGDDTWTGILAFCRKLLVDSLVGGEAYVLVLEEGPKVYRCTEWEEQYVTDDAGQVLEIYTSMNDDGEKLEIRFPKDAPDDALGTIQKTERGTVGEALPIYRDQFFEVEWSDGESLIKDAAYLALQIFNFESICDYESSRMVRSIQFGPPLKSDKTQMFYGSYVPLNDGLDTNAVTSLQLADRQSIEAMRTVIADKVMDLGRTLGLEAEFAEEIKYESGISKAFGLIDINAIVNMAGESCERGSNKAYEVWYARYGKPGLVPHITLSKELRPDARAADVELFRAVADYVNLPESRKEARKQMLLTAFRGIPASRMRELMVEVEALSPSVGPYNDLTGNSDTMSLLGQGGAVDSTMDNVPPIEGAPTTGAAADTAVAKDVALNGAQVTAQISVVEAYKNGTLGRDSASSILELSFGLSPEEAQRILGKGK